MWQGRRKGRHKARLTELARTPGPGHSGSVLWRVYNGLHLRTDCSKESGAYQTSLPHPPRPAAEPLLDKVLTPPHSLK